MKENEMLRIISNLVWRAIGIVIPVLFLYLPGICGQNHVGSDIRQVNWPDTYAGRWAKAFFKAYNTNGTDAIRRFIKEHYSEAYLNETPLEEEMKSGPLTIRNMVGKIKVHSVKADGDFVIDAIVKTENVGWVKYKIELAPDPPHDLIGMGPYAQIDPPDETIPEKDLHPPAAQSYMEWDNLHELLEQVCDDAGIPGVAAAIIHYGKITDKAATGVRRFGGNDSIQIGDLFQLGSVTKVFTGALLGRLVKKGTMKWDMTVGDILRNIPMRDCYRNVTLGDLLQFRGGLPNYPSGGEFASVMSFTFKSKRSPGEGREAHVRKVLSEEPIGDPNEEKYSSSAYVVAAYLAENVTNLSWEQLMHDLIFEPLGLSSATFGWPATHSRPDQPLGHYGTPPELTVQEIGYDPFGVHTYAGPAGDISCSIEDLARFATFQLKALNGQDSVLDAETVNRYWKAAKTEERLYGFFGSGGTFVAMIALYPDNDLGIVAAANHGLYAMPFLEKMRDAIRQQIASSSDLNR